jgi:hypothetical protein
MDNSDPQIVYDQRGICNHCREMILHRLPLNVTDPVRGRRQWRDAVATMTRVNREKPYDCVIGFSGGIDSSYVAMLCADAGLRVLLYHVNNGFDTQLARDNIEAMLTYSDLVSFDEFRMDAAEFRALQLAYFRAGVLDLDVPSDHVIVAAVRKKAAELGVNWIVSGGNMATNGFMPAAWTEPNKNDVTNLKNIYRRFGDGRPLTTFPFHGFLELQRDRYLRRLREVLPLNLVPFHRLHAPQHMRDVFGFTPYQDVHGENVFTRLYQRYILPERFGIDKRRAHYSCLILVKQMTRDEALYALTRNVYSQGDFEEDKARVFATLGIDEAMFYEFMTLPRHRCAEYGVQEDTLGYKVVTTGLRVLSVIR